jgi:hypothetical protein
MSLMTSTSRTVRCGPACRVVWQGCDPQGRPLCRLVGQLPEPLTGDRCHLPAPIHFPWWPVSEPLSRKRTSGVPGVVAGRRQGGLTDRMSLRSPGKDGGWCPIRLRLPAAIQGSGAVYR